MKNKDPNYAIKVEQAIAEKYGDETVQHPKKDWTDEKEKRYLEDLKAFYEKQRKSETEKEKKEGFLDILYLSNIFFYLNLFFDLYF